MPANIRKRLGIGPGSVIEWSEEGGKLVVRRAGKFSSEEIHRTLFPEGPPKPETIEDMKEAIRGYVKNRESEI